MCITNGKSDLNRGNPTIEMLGERSISNNTDNASTLERGTGYLCAFFNQFYKPNRWNNASQCSSTVKAVKVQNRATT
jgi:hypothetical protein